MPIKTIPAGPFDSGGYFYEIFKRSSSLSYGMHSRKNNFRQSRMSEDSLTDIRGGAACGDEITALLSQQGSFRSHYMGTDKLLCIGMEYKFAQTV